jgi:hypothetical protein
VADWGSDEDFMPAALAEMRSRSDSWEFDGYMDGLGDAGEQSMGSQYGPEDSTTSSKGSGSGDGN